MAECILLSIILLAWLIFGGTAFYRCSALKEIAGTLLRAAGIYIQSGEETRPPPQVDKALVCKVQADFDASDDNACGAFAVMVRGAIEVPTPMYETDVQVLIADITAGVDSPQPVLCAARGWQMDDSPAFCYRAYNGKIPNTGFVISDWLTVIRVPIDLLQFAAKGDRMLQFVTSLICHDTGNVLASASCAIEYRNDNRGYADAEGDAQETEILTIRLATAVSCVNAQTPQAAAAVLWQWIDGRCAADAHAPADSQRNRLLWDALDDTIRACNAGRGPDIEEICCEIVSVATVAEVYDALELCLRAVAGGGEIRRNQTELLSRIAAALAVDEEKFRALFQKILPIGMQQVWDPRFVLGITGDMTAQQKRNRLRDEYGKWNARINHPDDDVQAQASQMLTLIAEATDNLFHETTCK